MPPSPRRARSADEAPVKVDGEAEGGAAGADRRSAAGGRRGADARRFHPCVPPEAGPEPPSREHAVTAPRCGYGDV
eukprot:4700421-Prymnesium_polylepis.1